MMAAPPWSALSFDVGGQLEGHAICRPPIASQTFRYSYCVNTGPFTGRQRLINIASRKF